MEIGFVECNDVVLESSLVAGGVRLCRVVFHGIHADWAGEQLGASWRQEKQGVRINTNYRYFSLISSVSIANQ